MEFIIAISAVLVIILVLYYVVRLPKENEMVSVQEEAPYKVEPVVTVEEVKQVPVLTEVLPEVAKLEIEEVVVEVPAVEPVKQERKPRKPKVAPGIAQVKAVAKKTSTQPKNAPAKKRTAKKEI